jgi:histidinol-phosphate aminotransferase
MSRFWSAIVSQLDPYVPGEQPKVHDLIKLNTNENPYGPSPKALDAIKEATSDQLRLYSDPNADELKQTIADYYQVEKKQVFVGNGSDEVLAHTFQALLKQDAPLLFPEISYSFYPVYCGLYQITPKLIPLKEDFSIDFDDYPTENGGIIFPNPNAPTSLAKPLSDIRALLEKNQNSVVVVDEAYIDFGGESAVALVNEYPNLLVIQTLSKSRSLAGLRVGFAIGNAELIDGLERVKNSFNSYPLDRLALAGAVAAIKDKAYFDECCERVCNTRDGLTKELTSLGFEVVPSATNFVFAKHTKQDAEVIFKELRERKIIVRYFNKPKINQHLRISIGTEEETSALVTALKDILAKL